MQPTRWIIWTQAFLAAATLLASRADRGLAPRSLLPIAGTFSIVAFFLIPILPLAVVVLLLRSEGRANRKVFTFIATILLAVATFFCMLPQVQ